MVEKGKTLNLAIYPYDGYKADSIIINGISFPLIDNNYSLSNIDADLKVKVIFEKIVSQQFVTIKSSASLGGTISPLGETLVEVGKSITYTIKADTNHSIFSLKVNGVSVPISNTYTFKNVHQYSSIDVEFISSNMLTITKENWLFKGSRYVRNGVVIFTSTLSEEEKTNLHRFYLNGKCVTTKANGEQIGNCDWSFLNDESRILIGDQNYEILSLTEKQFVRSIECTFLGSPAILEITFGKPD